MFFMRAEQYMGKKCCHIGQIGCPILLVAQKAKLIFQNLTQCQALERLLLEFLDTINQLNFLIFPCCDISWI